MASTRGSRRFSDGRKHSRFDNPHMQNRNDTFQFNEKDRSSGKGSRGKPPLLQFTTDINPDCFSAPIPFSLVPNPPKISPSFPTEGAFATNSLPSDFHLDNRAVRRHCSSQGYSEDEHKYHRYRDHRERDREHSRERDKGQERDRSDDRTFNRISERVERDRDRGKDRDNRDEIPNNTIMVRSLHSSVAEADIRTEVVKYGLEPKDIRLIRHKDTGTSRGFGFVEFSLLSEAVRWKELTKGTIFVDGQHRSILHYSIPKEAMGAEKVLLNRSDWYCAKCAKSNFRRRDYCFKCNSRREDVGDVRSAEGCNEISSSPSNTLLFRNLDVLTTEERVLAMLGQLTTLPIKSLRVAKDTLTNTSRGFAFVELHSTSEATQLHDLLLSMNKNFYVDGRQVTVSYAKRSLSSMNSATSANAAVVALAAAQWSNQESESCSSTYGNFADENLKTGDVQTLGSAATVINSPDLGNVVIQGVTYKKYPIPDISTYQYDDSSGYYYDASTGLYYDSVSQYYYSYELQQYMYWDNTQKTYLPASETSTITSTVTPVSESDVADAENQDMGKNRKEEKLDKVKIAKKIAKDMEKWAKTLNQKKENAKLGITPILSSEPVFVVRTAKNIIKQSASADAGFAILERKTLLPEQNNFSSETTASKSLNKSNSTDKKISSLVAQYGDDSDTESEDETTDVEVKQKKSNEFDESKFLNWDKLACLLCKRQFPTKEVLLKHQQLSNLHKKNRTKLLSAQKN